MKLVVAMDQKGRIGKDNDLPWNYKDFPEDMKHFKNLTKGGTVIMGRKCFESMNGPLPDRFNVVVSTQDIESEHENLIFVTDINSALRDYPDAVVIGGYSVYNRATISALPTELFVTLIEDDFEGDTEAGLVNISRNYHMHSIKSFVGLDKNNTPYHIIKYIRKY